ncbi:MAG: translation initiation factor IF-2 [Spirochaetes bacterium]|nr:translation initiation factor IF-2 [Spirochaetota bacterium]
MADSKKRKTDRNKSQAHVKAKARTNKEKIKKVQPVKEKQKKERIDKDKLKEKSVITEKEEKKPPFPQKDKKKKIIIIKRKIKAQDKRPEAPRVEEKKQVIKPKEIKPVIKVKEVTEKEAKRAPYKRGVTFRKGYYEKKEFEKRIDLVKKKPEEIAPRILPKEINITETITVGEMAKKMNIKASELIKKMMELGEIVTINKVMDADTATLVGSEYGINVKVISLYEETKIQLEEDDKKKDHIQRSPVVTIMGHVDHGKTLLLDVIRKSNIIAHEAGGITQHIGAYKVKIDFKGRQEEIVFVDTPGHEAFTTMRARGAQVTDIVVLIIAADDGIMPQTIESINHAKEAKVPIIVAINKIDLKGVSTHIERIKQELTKYQLLPEEWGGDVMVVTISAKEQKNIEKLLESILVQAEILELKANPRIMARGTILESKKDPARGATATVLIQNGTLKLGDPFVAGIHSGKVRAMYNDWTQPIREAPPSTPVLITGLDGIPLAGDPFQVVDTEKYSRLISQKRKELKKEDVVKSIQKISLDNLYEQIKKGKIKELKIVLKADVEGSVEALRHSLTKLSTDEVQLKIIHHGVGDIAETDVMLTSASNAIIIGFNVKYNKKVEELAKKEKVSIRLYKIIYDAIDDIKKAMEGLLEPLLKEEGRGFAEVMQVFPVSRYGVIAGCKVTSGKIMRGDNARIIRDDEIIYEGRIESLKRFKDDVKEVSEGLECGIYLGPDFKNIKESDVIESYIVVKLPRTL